MSGRAGALKSGVVDLIGVIWEIWLCSLRSCELCDFEKGRSIRGGDCCGRRCGRAEQWVCCVVSRGVMAPEFCHGRKRFIDWSGNVPIVKGVDVNNFLALGGSRRCVFGNARTGEVLGKCEEVLLV